MESDDKCIAIMVTSWAGALVLVVALVCITKGCQFDSDTKIALAENGIVWKGQNTHKAYGSWEAVE